MNPDEHALLEKVAELTERNNRLLATMEKRGKWLAIWGFVKIALFILPLIAGYIFLQPYFGSVEKSLDVYRNLLN